MRTHVLIKSTAERVSYTEDVVKTRKTTNRKLESFLYAVGIAPIKYEVLWDGMVQWTYRDTPEFRQHCEYFKELKIQSFRESRR